MLRAGVHSREHRLPYLLWIKIDVFPFRCGHDDWLDQAVAHLDRSDVFAVGGAFHRRWDHHDGPWPGWKFVHQCTINFALMKQSIFRAALQEAAGEFVAGGFRGEHPFAAEDSSLKRFLLEHSFGKYIERHRRYTLVASIAPSAPRRVYGRSGRAPDGARSGPRS